MRRGRLGVSGREGGIGGGRIKFRGGGEGR